jgi:D-3-phosphoglycerate dehydrogenase
LDVLEYEKTSFEQLSTSGFTDDMQYIIESKKTILSPHVAGWTIESNIKIAEVLLQKIITDSPQ